MEREFLQLDVWDQFTAGEAEAIARALAHCLPPPWAFDSVAYHQMGDQARQVAFFTWNEARFALVPGGAVTLGVGPEARAEVVARHAQEWEEAHEDYRASYPTLPDYLDLCLAPERCVVLKPFLIELTSSPYRERREPRPPDGPSPRPPDRLRTTMSEGGMMIDVYSCPMAPEAIEAELAAGGFRLPAPDEWEHACAAGSRSVWRWGNSLPPEDGYSILRQPNAFGLTIAHETYCDEICSPPLTWRGGDGGCSSCGGEAQLAIILVLAAAYRDPEQALSAAPPEEPRTRVLHSPRVRRAFSLPPDCLD